MENGVFITNINASVDDKALRTYFSQFGQITDLNLQPDKFNDSAKICYIKYSTNEGAAKSVQLADKSTHFGDSLRVSFKKFTERNSAKSSNGPTAVCRMQSFGRGRGALLPTPGAAQQPGALLIEHVRLKDLMLPTEKKLAVEIVELKSLTNILARPLQLTDKFRSNLYSLLEKINENIGQLATVRNPQVAGFYLAKWKEDNKFYRAKIIDKLSEREYQVCFVDEGTSGDIVNELRVIPQDLVNIPCQFVKCTVDCNDSAELIELVLKEGSESVVSIYCTSITKVVDKLVVNVFINDRDIIDIYKSKYGKDPRIENVPKKSDIKPHALEQQSTLNCQLIRNPKDKTHVTAILTELSPQEFRPKLQPLITSPTLNDLLIYKDKDGTLHRCFIDSYKFDNSDTLNYSVSFIDQNKLLNAVTKDSLMKSSSIEEINSPPKLMKCVLDCEIIDQNQLYHSAQSIKLSDYDSRKDLYVIDILSKKNTPIIDNSIIGKIKTVSITHIESCNEFYVQFIDDKAAMLSLETISTEMNDGRYNKAVGGGGVKVNDIVIAPFLQVNYRAIVRQLDSKTNRGLLFFMDFGNSEWTAIGDCIKNVQIGKIDPIAHKCRLSVSVIGLESIKEATEMLTEYCDGGDSAVHMKIVGVEESGTLIVNLTAKNKSNFGDILEFKGLVKSGSSSSSNNSNSVTAVKTAQKAADVRVLLENKIVEMEKRMAALEKQWNIVCRK